MDLTAMEQVMEVLNQLGHPATLEYPGWISVEGYAFGTVNENWEGDREGKDVLETGVPSSSTDTDAIAAAIIAALSSTNNPKQVSGGQQQTPERKDTQLFKNLDTFQRLAGKKIAAE
jgi:hypothetical protein